MAVEKPLALDATERGFGPFGVRDFSVVVPEIELSEIPFQVLFATMLVHPFHPTLEDPEIAFHRIRVDPAGLGVLAQGMMNAPVARVFAPDMAVMPRLVGH